MTSTYEIAMTLYARAAAVFARRANAPDAQPAQDSETAALAAGLALPNTRAPAAGEAPALASIMGRLHGGDFNGYYAPQIMAVDAAQPLTAAPANMADTYARLWSQFVRDRQRFVKDEQPPEIREKNLHALLQRYTWAMAAPPVEGAQAGANVVSLFDYARISAALAVCLEHRDPALAEPALLVGGDLSGVQEWLYRFSSRGAAKSLRGRSFYLQLLTEIVALYVLDRLHLPMANLLYAGGGNFYLLVPTAQAGELESLRKQIGRKLLAMHNGDLYIALASAPLSYAMLRDEDGQNVGQAWDAVNRHLNGYKARRFAELEPAEMAQAIGSALAGTGELNDICGVCRRTITAAEQGEALDEGRKCDLCRSFEQLGNLLRDAEFLVLSRVPDTNGKIVTDWQQGLRQFGYDVQLVRTASESESGWEDPGGDLVFIYYWQQAPDVRDFPGWPGDRRTVWAFRPLAQCIPIKSDDDIATFDELQSDGIHRWGVLRMDVDNLGAIFQHGLPASNLCQVVGLSSLLRLFFEGYVPQVAQTLNETRDGLRTYLMYAGGDDLFVVGGWSDLPGLAQRIREEFAHFACHNPKVTISGGVSIALDDKYPLYQAARSAGEAEHQAKAHGKNALAFLDQPMHWGTEYDRVWERVQQVTAWVNGPNAKLPRSFLMTLRAIDAEWRAWKKQEAGAGPRYQHADREMYLGPWQWHLVYSLTRAAERRKDNALKREIDEFVASIVAGEITTLGVMARWTELLTRR